MTTPRQARPAGRATGVVAELRPLGTARVGDHADVTADDPKLRPPRQRRRLVDRPRLVETLLEAQGPLVSVVASPGYGKTTLLAQWCHADPRPAAWVTLDNLDNDPATLLTWLAVALAALPGAGPVPAGRLTGRRVGLMLSSVDQPVMVVLDDVHVLHELGAIDAVTDLIPYLPDDSVLVLGGRRQPVTLSRLRVGLDLLELGPADLALDVQETWAVLTAAGLTVQVEEAEALNARTEGWPALVTLAASAVRRGASLPLSASVDGRHVAEYLHSELMARLRPQTVEFMHRSAVLDPLTGPTCDAVLRRRGSAAVLEELAADHQLVLPVDTDRDRYRYHPVLRDLLLSELARDHPQQLVELRRRACRWCSEHGDPWGAVQYAYDAGDLDVAADLVLSMAQPAFADGHAATVEGWLEQLERAGVLDRRAELAVLWAILLTLEGRDTAAERWAARALSDSPADDTRGPDSSVAALRLMLRALRCENGPARMRLDAQQYVALLEPSSQWAPGGIAMEGIADWLDGATEHAVARLRDAVSLAQHKNASGASIAALGILSLLHADDHRWHEARTCLVDGLSIVDQVGLEQYGLAGILQAAAVRVHDHDGDEAARRTSVARFDALRPRMMYGGTPALAVLGRLTVARVHRAHGDWEAARTLLAEMQAVLASRPDLGRLVTDVAEFAESLGNRRGNRFESSTLTVAELRLLPLLPTHLSFRGIGERLFLSQHTIKTQALSIYRKLGATSRDAAVTRARELGLLDD